METPGGMLKWLIYSSLCVAADVLDTVVFTIRAKPTFHPSDVGELSDQEIVELAGRASKLHSDSGVFKLTPHTVAKASQDLDEDASDASEANALNLVFAETTIPVPRVHRVVKRKWDYQRSNSG
ncbi:hypothetical protein VKT23_011443 [Stygiomarasmius scandens]|uniref:Uncharacterized protein n=1 Tax=Marasmiellus scandens TaxID=2682957 RepID=A0ABR1J918_9AGAR